MKKVGHKGVAGIIGRMKKALSIGVVGQDGSHLALAPPFWRVSGFRSRACYKSAACFTRFSDFQIDITRLTGGDTQFSWLLRHWRCPMRVCQLPRNVGV